MPTRKKREPVWLPSSVVLAIHEEQLAEHSGLSGCRDPGGLEAALGRPKNLFVYSDTAEPTLPMLAAAYAFGIARNHPFIDGNKRTSLVVAETFLNLNGLSLTATDAECVATFLSLAEGTLSEEQLYAWIERHTTPRRGLP